MSESDPKSDQPLHRASGAQKQEKRSWESVALPTISLRPARLVTSAALRKASAPRADSIASQQTGNDAQPLASETAPRHSAPGLEPIKMLSQSAAKAQTRQPAPDTPPVSQPAQKAAVAPSFGYSRSGQKSEIDQWQELEALIKRIYRGASAVAGPALRSLRYILSHSGYLRAHRKLVGTLAVVVLAVWFSDSPLVQNSYGAAGNLVQPVVDQIKSRAAYQIVDDFNTVGEWWSDQGLVPEESGAVRVAGFALHQGTMDLTSYRMDFVAKIERRSLGWVVRAADKDTYYAFKLTQLGRGKNAKHRLVRYPVVQGQPDESKKAEIDLPDQLISDDFNRISVRIRDSQLVTFINGRSVDYWSDARVPRGGVGFWVEKGESGLVDKMAISGNEDFWGLTIYGALQTLDAVNSFVKSLIADPEKVASQLKKGVSDLSSTTFEN